MMPLDLFNGGVSNLEERVVYVAKLLGYKLPLEGYQRNMIKRLLTDAEHAAEQKLLSDIGQIGRTNVK